MRTFVSKNDIGAKKMLHRSSVIYLSKLNISGLPCQGIVVEVLGYEEGKTVHRNTTKNTKRDQWKPTREDDVGHARQKRENGLRNAQASVEDLVEGEGLIEGTAQECEQ